MQSGPKGLCKVGLIKVQELRKDVPSRAGAMWAKQGLSVALSLTLSGTLSQKEPERIYVAISGSLLLVAVCGSLSLALSGTFSVTENLCGSLWLSVALCGSLSLAHSGALSSDVSRQKLHALRSEPTPDFNQPWLQESKSWRLAKMYTAKYKGRKAKYDT